MLTNPTAVDLIESVKVSLLNDIMPELQSDRARVLVMMMQTLLTSVQRRVPLEQQYMADECNRMTALLREAVQCVAGTSDGSAVELHAIAADLDAQPDYTPLPTFAELNTRYRAISERFTAALGPLNALDGAGDAAASTLLTKFRAYMNLRTARDMQAHFAMDAGLVGRG
jgi:hypothetical protein